MAGVYVQNVTITDTPKVIVPGLKNVYVTVFAIGGNVDNVYIGDSSVSYNQKYGLPIGQFAIFDKKIFIENSDDLYFSGLLNDKLGVVIEQSPIIDDIIPALADLGALIASTPLGTVIDQTSQIQNLQDQVTSLKAIVHKHDNTLGMKLIDFVESI